MTDLRTATRELDAARETVVWIDDDQAVISERAADGRERVEHVDRQPAESRPAFEIRTIREIVDRDRLVVSGPAGARLGFERAYVAMTHRPDRLVDGQRSTPASQSGRRTD
jgi:hypothetical protein